MNENIFKFLRDKWTLQLHHEYESICYQYGIKLKKPIILVEKTKNNWGQWDKSKKVLLISEDLIKQYSWEIVLQILKHEMAHQIVSDIFCVEEGHGDYFNTACKMIGIEGDFCKASIALEEQFIHWKNKKIADEEEILINKIQKLLNLAQSTNEHESALAMSKVQEMYEKYNIQKIKLGHTQNYYTLSINFKKKRIPKTHSVAAFILQEHFFVRVIFSSLYDAMQNASHKTIELLGLRENIVMAEYVFHFLIDRLEILWENYSKNKQLSLKYKLSFQQGILEGFLKKLEHSKNQRGKQNQQNEAQLHALIKLTDVKLQEFVQSKFPKVTQKSNSSSGVYTEHFQQGVEEGKKINLNKPIYNKAKDSGRFLTN